MNNFPAAVQHAIRALTALAAQPKGALVMVRKLAVTESITVPALAKTLQQLARKGLLTSEKGRGGGFTLARPPREITIAQIIEAIEGRAALHRCSLGYASCRPKQPCYLDRLLAPTRATALEQLNRATLQDLVRTRTRLRKNQRTKKKATA